MQSRITFDTQLKIAPNAMTLLSLQETNIFPFFLLVLLLSQLRSLPCEELQHRMQTLDMEMEKEIEGLRSRYQAKRQPILDAMEAKKRRQQNF